jgi:hypothetical protein
MLDMYAEDAVFDLSPVFTDAVPMHGHQHMRDFWMSLRETWGGGVRLDPLEFFEVNERCFVLDLRLWGKGTRSGIEIDQRFAMVYTVDPKLGKVLHARLLPDLATALAEAESSASRTG